jgi:plasmid stabilization system protein ParE
MTVEVTSQARLRLLEIWKRIAEDFSQDRADKVELRLLARASELKAHPHKGPPEPALAYRGQGHRFLLLGRYKIIYLVAGEKVFVTDFFDTKQHPSRMRG